jgi:hypothetical protein
MVGPFVAEKSFRDGAELVVNQWRKGFHCAWLALLPEAQQLRDFALFRV